MDGLGLNLGGWGGGQVREVGVRVCGRQQLSRPALHYTSPELQVRTVHLPLKHNLCSVIHTAAHCSELDRLAAIACLPDLYSVIHTAARCARAGQACCQIACPRLLPHCCSMDSETANGNCDSGRSMPWHMHDFEEGITDRSVHHSVDAGTSRPARTACAAADRAGI